MVEEAFVAYLADLAAVYPFFVPERADRPAIVYKRVSTDREMTHSGPTGSVSARFIFSAHHNTHPEVLALARELLDRLHGKGPEIDFSIDLVTVEDEIDLGFEPDAESWTMSLDAVVQYQEN